MILRLLAELRSVADSKFGFNMQFPGIVVVSYAWAAAEHPDGKGNMIREVLAPAIEWYMSERAALIRDQEFWAAELDAETTELEAVDFALFLDFSSLYQKPRDEAQDESFKRALADMELLHTAEMAQRSAQYAQVASGIYEEVGGKALVFQRPTVKLGNHKALYDLGYCRNIVATEVPLEDQSSHMNSTISVMSGFSCTGSVYIPDSDGAEE